MFAAVREVYLTVSRDRNDGFESVRARARPVRMLVFALRTITVLSDLRKEVFDVGTPLVDELSDGVTAVRRFPARIRSVASFTYAVSSQSSPLSNRCLSPSNVG